MDAFIEMLNSIATDSTTRFGSFLWQSTLLVFVVTLAAKLLGRATPAVRFWLWQIVAVKLLLLPFWSVNATPPAWLATTPTTPTHSEIAPLTQNPNLPQTLPVPTQPQPPYIAPPFAVSQPSITPTPPTPKLTWQAWLILLWLAVILFRLTRILHQGQQLRRLLRQAIPAIELTSLVSSCATSLGLRTSPTTLLIEIDTSPFVCGLRQPTLVLPLVLLKSLTQNASPEQLQQIVLHELAHIQRRDLLWCWIPNLVQIVYWFHPVAYWVSHQVQLERELACDQLAMKLSGSSAGEYAQTLIEVVSQTSATIVLQKTVLSHSLLGRSVS